MRILAIIPDGHPTHRPDVSALFGRYLPRLDIHTDLVTHEADDALGSIPEWSGGRALLYRRTSSRARDQIVGFCHDIGALWAARPGDYQAIQVRDKVFVAVFATWITRHRRLPLFYWMSFPKSEGYIHVARSRGFSLGILRWLFLMFKGHVGRALLYRHVLPQCTHVFVQSDQMRMELAARGVSRDRMTVVPMGVDLERALPARGDALHHDRLQGRRVVVYVGSFERSRQLEFLLQVTQKLASADPRLMLLMIGDGPEPDDRAHLERTAQSLGIADRVVWTGWVSSMDTWRWVAGADVAVSLLPRSTLYDLASPTKVVEYLALGVPVVANDQPDQQKVIEESGAGLCCDMCVGHVASAIEKILLNPALSQRMRNAGPGYVAAERGYDRIATRVAEAYRRYATAAP
jgi:glycosyltransferase involved in cell wall biosynthesis